MLSPLSRLARLLLLAAVTGLLTGCERPAPPPPAPRLVLSATEFSRLPGWGEDDLREVLPALRRSCARLATQPEERPLGPEGLAGRAGDWRAACVALASVPGFDGQGLRAVIEREFRPFALSDGAGAEGLVTGYYEAELAGARAPDAAHQVPLYPPPADLVTLDLADFRADLPRERLVGRVAEGRLVPYFSRREIEGGALSGRASPLLWVADPVEAFILQIQGSGRVELADGTLLRVGYAASNGRPFTPIGRLLIEEKRLPADGLSMQRIRAWLKAHPEEAERLMQRNERYVFFREIDGDGPIGAQGVALTAGRSLAVDPAFLPLGAPLYIATSWPGQDRALERLMVAQDSGSAIKGPLRSDFFWGSGESALEQAGRMKQKGRYWLLLPRSVAERLAKAEAKASS